MGFAWFRARHIERSVEPSPQRRTGRVGARFAAGSLQLCVLDAFARTLEISCEQAGGVRVSNRVEAATTFARNAISGSRGPWVVPPARNRLQTFTFGRIARAPGDGRLGAGPSWMGRADLVPLRVALMLATGRGGCQATVRQSGGASLGESKGTVPSR